MAKHVTGLTALDIAKWFINSTDRESGDEATHLKIQKLIYYAQGWFLANYDQMLFVEDLQAWAHGPVAVSVWDQFKGYGFDSIPPQKVSKKLGLMVEEFLEAVNEEYGGYTAKRLERMTHSEPPWRNARGNLAPDARCSNVISKKDMKEFFESQLEDD